MAETRYKPYGEERWSSGVAVTDFTYTSQRAERGFGLLDYRARFYHPGLGRFLSPDTVVPSYENPQNLSRYAYALGNPVKFNDPSGHCPPIESCMRGNPLDPWYPARELWHTVFGPDRPSRELEPPSDLPNRTVFGQSNVAVEADIVPGVEVSWSKTLAFNFASGHLSSLRTFSFNFTAGTPEGISVSGGLHGGSAEASTNDALLGPARAFSVNAGIDDFLQASVVYQRNEPLDNFWTDPHFWETLAEGDINTAVDMADQPFIDPGTGKPVTAESLGISIGANTIPNQVEGGISLSPGLNYTWKAWEINIYPWNWFRK